MSDQSNPILVDKAKNEYEVLKTRVNKRKGGIEEWLCRRTSDNKEMWCPLSIIDEMKAEKKLKTKRQKK